MDPPADLLDRLRCDICRKYLSVPPVCRLGEATSCGRCATGWPRNREYEALARLVKWECSYCADATGTRFGWGGEVERHEARCKRDAVLCPAAEGGRFEETPPIARPYRPAGEYHRDCQRLALACPSDSCDSIVELRHLRAHFERHHPDNVLRADVVSVSKNLKEEKVWDYRPEAHACLVLHGSGVPFVLFVHARCEHDERSGDIGSYDYEFGVYSLCRRERKGRFGYDVTVRLESGAQDDATTFVESCADQEVCAYDPRIHRVAFLRAGLANFSGFDFMTTKFRKLPRPSRPTLRYDLRIRVAQPPATTTKLKKDDDLTITTKLFECPICKEYFSPPIYNCRTGHSFCSECKLKLVTCPYCRALIGESRNYALEEASETLRLCCAHETDGCDFVGAVREVKAHEAVCAYR